MSSSVQTRRTFLAASATAALTQVLPTSKIWADTRSSENDHLRGSAVTLARAIQSRQISSEQAVDACLRRIEEVNPKINAVVTLCRKEALEQARKADDDLRRGVCRGPWHGVPMTIKDSLDTAGVKTTAGTEGRKDFIPKSNATVVDRLLRSGAILLGKTNTPEITMDYRTDNLLFGSTKNPYNIAKSPGGSSGGAAAIVAAGGSPFDVGSDTGGSIRVPSGFCGTAGIKPTSGRVPRTGHIIGFEVGYFEPLTQLGPIARHVEDLFPLLKTIAGSDDDDPAVVDMPLLDPEVVDISRLRISFHSDNGVLAAVDQVRAAVESAVSALKNAGCSVEQNCPKPLSRIMDIWHSSLRSDGGESIKAMLAKAGTKRCHRFLEVYQESEPLRGDEFNRFLRHWQEFRADMHRWFTQYDAIVCPVNAYASLPVEYPLGELLAGFTYTYAYNLTGWPGAVVRAGTSPDGVPIGVQIIARPWREDVCLAVAGHLERVLGGWKMPEL